MGEIKQEINWRFVADSLMALANDSGELEEVKAERDRLKRHVGDLILDLNNARFDANVSASERDELAQEVRKLENDNRIDAWYRLADHPFFKDCFDSDDTLIGAMLTKLDGTGESQDNLIPRTITTDELREGQTVALMEQGCVMYAGAVGETFGDPIEKIGILASPGYRAVVVRVAEPGHTIVLLADAPAKDVCTSTGHVKDRADSLHVTAEDIRNSEPGAAFGDREEDLWKWDGKTLQVQCRGYTRHSPEHVLKVWGPLLRSTAAPRGTYPKRLTVADLDAAPVGSVLELENHCPLVRDIHGVWLGEEANYDPMFIHRWSDIWDQATLTPPEKPELPTEPGQHIRITAISGDSNIMPEEAVLIGEMWESLDGERDWSPGEITEWEHIRLVVEDGA